MVGKATVTDYHISINMAKELSMVENNNKGYVSIKDLVLDNGKVVYSRMWTAAGRAFLLSAVDHQSI